MRESERESERIREGEGERERQSPMLEATPLCIPHPHLCLMLAMVCFSLTPMVKRTGTTSTISPRRSGSSGSPSRQLGGSRNCTIIKSLREEGERKRGGREVGRIRGKEKEREGEEASG